MWGPVSHEPVVRECNSTDNSPTLIADLTLRGVWTPLTKALFEIHVVDTDAWSYLNQTPLNVLTNAEKEKKEDTKLHQKRDELCSTHCVISGQLAGE